MIDPYGPTGLIRAVELYRPATVSIVRRLKSNLGEMLTLVLSLFLRVPQVSVLVPSVASAAKLSSPSPGRANRYAALPRAGSPCCRRE